MTLPFEAIAWWIAVIEVPVLSGLFWLVWRMREDGENRLDALRHQLEQRCQQLRDALAAHRLEAARAYAHTADVKELERRLIGHLLRIEAKLDATALKAEALRATHHYQQGDVKK